MSEEDKLNDLQMQINTLKAEFERLNGIIIILHKRINKLQSVML